MVTIGAVRRECSTIQRDAAPVLLAAAAPLSVVTGVAASAHQLIGAASP
jgi:hypothetical protein